MLTISCDAWSSVAGGVSKSDTLSQIKGYAEQAMPIAKHLPAAAYFAYALSSVASGGAFSAPHAVGLLYQVAWYQSTRMPIGSTCSLNQAD